MHLKMDSKAYKTAKARKALPSPTKFLLKCNAIIPPVLDFGCGNCHSINNKYFVADGYDAHSEFYQTDLKQITATKYDTIICNYVLNTIPECTERENILKTIQLYLAENGLAFITVRNDKPVNGWGENSKGTYQKHITSIPFLRCIYICPAYRTFLLTKSTKLV